MRPSRYIECENATDELRMCVNTVALWEFIHLFKRIRESAQMLSQSEEC